MRRKQKTLHERLEKTLQEVAPLFKCTYIKIPDVNKKVMWLIRKNKRYDLRPDKRPFDGILITKKRNYCIEVKIQYDKLKPHQSYWQSRVNSINRSFYIIRRKKLKDGIKYQIEHNGDIIKVCLSIDEVICCFINGDL